MESLCFIRFLLVISMSFLSSLQAYDFDVGGREGWISNPSETFNHWAERNRFKISDSLVFKYTKGEDSVMLVNIEDYDTCNTANPVMCFNDGNSTFTFYRSGAFFFISGVTEHCNNGQKMTVVVMANHPPAPSMSPQQSPSSSPSPSESYSGVSGPAPSPSDAPPSISFNFRVSLGLLVSVVLGFHVGSF